MPRAHRRPARSLSPSRSRWPRLPPRSPCRSPRPPTRFRCVRVHGRRGATWAGCRPDADPSMRARRRRAGHRGRPPVVARPSSGVRPGGNHHGLAPGRRRRTRTGPTRRAPSDEDGADVVASPSSAVAPVLAPEPERPRPPRPRPPRRRRLRAPEPGAGEPPSPVPVAVEPPLVDPGASPDWAISVPETAEPRSSFILAPFVLGGATAVLAERTGSVAPERPMGRRVGTGGPGGLASSVARPAVGTPSP